MTGYLNNLLFRTFQASSGSVEPMLTPLFASPRGEPVAQQPEPHRVQDGEVGVTGPARTNRVSESNRDHEGHVAPAGDANALSIERSATMSVATPPPDTVHETSTKTDPLNVTAKSSTDERKHGIVTQDMTRVARTSRLAPVRKESDLGELREVEHKEELSKASRQMGPIEGDAARASLYPVLHARTGRGTFEDERSPQDDADKLSRPAKPPTPQSHQGVQSRPSVAKTESDHHAEYPAQPTADNLDASEMLVVKRPSKFVVPVLNTTIAPRSLWTPPTTRPQSPAGVTPTIQVTIGRVEVRGPIPNETRQQPAQPAPRPTLHDYLRKRSGRSRE